MVFKTPSREYAGSSALGIVAEMEHDAVEYPFKGNSLRAFLAWSLSRLEDCVPLRELDAGARINDETLALAYLCLCDEYGLGVLVHDWSRREYFDGTI